MKILLQLMENNENTVTAIVYVHSKVMEIIENSKFKYSETCQQQFLKALTIGGRRIEVDVNEKSYGGAVLRIVYCYYMSIEIKG